MLRLVIGDYNIETLTFIVFNNKMIKSKSYSSNLTAANTTISNNAITHNLKLNYVTTYNNPSSMLVTTLNSPKTSKFSKKLVHKPTQMNIFKESEPKNRKLCLKVIEVGRRVTMLQSKSLEQSLKKGEFSHLSNQSPVKPLIARNFQDFGAKNNKRRITSNNNLSIAAYQRLTGSMSILEGVNEFRAKEKKHFEAPSDFKKNLQWKEPKRLRPNEANKYKQVKNNKNEVQKNKKSSYLQMHMKYKILK